MRGAIEIPFRITQYSDLNFGRAPQGDGPKTVPPGSRESGGNASFEIVGPANKTFSIVFPEEVVYLESLKDGSSDRIPVTNFRSFPTEGENSVLSLDGRAKVFVGATRGALRNNQTAGGYQGQFIVEVIY